ncbi:MAG: transglycosylase SLT domain-containing protein [bacterium]|nr:transglycosylase SLT domain-containing protein [bacterium]
MNRWLTTLLLLLAAAAPARAALLVDPCLEDFRVGDLPAGPTAFTPQGWAGNLFERPAWSPQWSAAWDGLFRATPAERSRLAAWPLIVAICGDDTAAADRWWDDLAATWRDASLGRPLAVPDPSAEAWLSYERLSLAMFQALDRADTAAARVATEAILALDGLDDETRLIWSLRGRALAAQAAEPGPWEELLDLHACDRDAGWDLWRARAAAIGRDPLTLPSQPARWARWLVAAGDDALAANQLERLSVPTEVRAGLGARLLAGAELRRHFQAHPTPPADEELQDWWLQGRLRLAGFSAEEAERLSALPGLTPANRAGLLRRAGDRRAGEGLWGAALADFRTALLLAERSGKFAVLNRVRGEIDRARSLADQQERPDIRRELDALWSPPAVRETEGPRVAAARAKVRRGNAPDLVAQGQNDFLARSRGVEAAVWRIWARQGRSLAQARLAEPAAAGYDSLLGVVAAAGRLSEQRRAAAAACGAVLAPAGCGERVGRWLLAAAAAAACPTLPPSEPSPVPALVEAHADDLVRHALYGAALLAGDDRGRMAAGTRTPRGMLSEDERLLLVFPVPTQAAVAAQLAGGAEPRLALAVARNESLFDPAVRSHAGALGYMQIMPFHYRDGARRGGDVDWRRCVTSLEKGRALLNENTRRYRGDPYRTLAAYNAGPAAVGRWSGQLGRRSGRKAFLEWIGYAETRQYVEKVLIDREVYGWILNDAAGALGAGVVLD